METIGPGARVQLPVFLRRYARAGPYNIHTNVLTITSKSPGLDSHLVLLLLFIVVTSGWSQDSQSAMTRECLVCITG